MPIQCPKGVSICDSLSPDLRVSENGLVAASSREHHQRSAGDENAESHNNTSEMSFQIDLHSLPNDDQRSRRSSVTFLDGVERRRSVRRTSKLLAANDVMPRQRLSNEDLVRLHSFSSPDILDPQEMEVEQMSDLSVEESESEDTDTPDFPSIMVVIDSTFDKPSQLDELNVPLSIPRVSKMLYCKSNMKLIDIETKRSVCESSHSSKLDMQEDKVAMGNALSLLLKFKQQNDYESPKDNEDLFKIDLDKYEPTDVEPDRISDYSPNSSLHKSRNSVEIIFKIEELSKEELSKSVVAIMKPLSQHDNAINNHEENYRESENTNDINMEFNFDDSHFSPSINRPTEDIMKKVDSDKMSNNRLVICSVPENTQTSIKLHSDFNSIEEIYETNSVEQENLSIQKNIEEPVHVENEEHQRDLPMKTSIETYEKNVMEQIDLSFQNDIEEPDHVENEEHQRDLPMKTSKETYETIAMGQKDLSFQSDIEEPGHVENEQHLPMKTSIETYEKNVMEQIDISFHKDIKEPDHVENEEHQKDLHIKSSREESKDEEVIEETQINESEQVEPRSEMEPNVALQEEVEADLLMNYPEKVELQQEFSQNVLLEELELKQSDLKETKPPKLSKAQSSTTKEEERKPRKPGSKVIEKRELQKTKPDVILTTKMLCRNVTRCTAEEKREKYLKSSESLIYPNLINIICSHCYQMTTNEIPFQNLLLQEDIVIIHHKILLNINDIPDAVAATMVMKKLGLTLLPESVLLAEAVAMVMACCAKLKSFISRKYPILKDHILQMITSSKNLCTTRTPNITRKSVEPEGFMAGHKYGQVMYINKTCSYYTGQPPFGHTYQSGGNFNAGSTRWKNRREMQQLQQNRQKEAGMNPYRDTVRTNLLALKKHVGK